LKISNLDALAILKKLRSKRHSLFSSPSLTARLECASVNEGITAG
jgi:hypothetical protein